MTQYLHSLHLQRGVKPGLHLYRLDALLLVALVAVLVNLIVQRQGLLRQPRQMVLVAVGEID
jgi:hypothetical protein